MHFLNRGTFLGFRGCFVGSYQHFALEKHRCVSVQMGGKKKKEGKGCPQGLSWPARPSHSTQPGSLLGTSCSAPGAGRGSPRSSPGGSPRGRQGQSQGSWDTSGADAPACVTPGACASLAAARTTKRRKAARKAELSQRSLALLHSALLGGIIRGLSVS